MAKVTELKTREDFDALLEVSHANPVILLKHSIACPISARAQEQFVQLENEADPPLYCLVVQYARDVSNYVAEKTGIRHETPQAIVFASGEATFHTSHHAITAGRLRDAARESSSTSSRAA
jgi:bacillithiol system protein YtxJ